MSRLVGREGGQIRVGSGSVQVADSDFAIPGNTLVCAFRNPDREEIGLGIVLSGDVASLRSLTSRIPHYSKYSYVGFEGSRSTLKGVWPERKSPLAVDFRER